MSKGRLSDDMEEERPAWQVDACPRWCTGGHGENDHADDRVHRSVAVAVPAVTRTRHLGATRVETVDEAVELEIGLSRTDGELTTWLYLGAGRGRELEVSVGTAQVVLRVALAEMVRGSET